MKNRLREISNGFLFILLTKFTNLYVLIACKLRLQPINLRKVVKSGILWKILPDFSKNKRLIIAVPLFVVGYIVSKVDFSILWRYFTWANQTTAMVMLWTAAAYLYRYNKFHWVCTIPAAFISTVCFTYLAYNKIGFGLDYQLSVYIGLGLTVLCLVLFFTQLKPLGARDEEAYVNN